MDHLPLNASTCLAVASLLLLLSLAGCSTGAVDVQPGCLYGDCLKGLAIQRDRGGIFVGKKTHGSWDGEGSYQDFSGDNKYFGAWKDGAKHGSGTMVLPAGTVVGQWVSGIPATVTYTGRDGVFRGALANKGHRYPYLSPMEGEIVWPGGERYRGSFGCPNLIPCGLPQGEGEFHSSSGEIIRGTFTTDGRKGIVVQADGTRKYYVLEMEDNHSPITFRFKSFSSEEPFWDRFNRFFSFLPDGGGAMAVSQPRQ